MRNRLKGAGEIVTVGTALIVAGGVVLGLAHLHVLGWFLIGAGILLLAIAVLWLMLAWMGSVVAALTWLRRLLLRPLRFVWRLARHWNPFFWRGSPIGWRGVPSSRKTKWRVVPGDEWHEMYTSGVTCACYFTPNADANVTETIRGLVDPTGRLNLVIRNDVFRDAIPPDGDPEKDVPKELCIDYVLNGETHSVTYKENENVDLQVGH